ncbi:MFS transporter [Segeticoccus rhizosphaerae]|jgi:EmrB/QacA subfamily drug resistance transporter|uniref:MFS transporter n=3 Tax=Segeticoccus rhizosphaerae TaxID=1104777 RepID=UPI0010C0E8DF|nr:MFS transporter [Ornithinicoccus soli]
MSSQTNLLLRGAPAPAQPRHSKTVLLAVILVAQLMVVLDMSIVNVALPSIQQALGFTSSGLSWVLNAYTLAFGGLLLLGARAGDIFGRRRVFLAGVAVFSLASLAGGLATAGWWLLAARGVQGFGAALAAPAVLALLASEFPEGRERTRALGLYSAASVGGAAIGLVAGGMLVQWTSWRWVMFVNVPVGLGLLVAALVVVRNSARAAGRFDLGGAISSTVGMTALVYGFVHAASDGWQSTTTLASFALGAVLMAAFVLIERRAAMPVVPLGLFADRGRAGAYIGRLLLVAGMTGMFFFLTLFLQDVLGYGPLTTGMAFLPVTVALFTSAQFSARVWVERFGPRRVILAGLALSTLSMLWLSRLGAGDSYLDVLGPLILFGAGNGAAFVPLTSVGLSGVPAQQSGAASGLMNAMQQVGGSLGLAVLVTVFGSASRGAQALPGAGAVAQAHHAFAVGADQAFLASAGLLALTLVMIVVLVRQHPRESLDLAA